MLNGALLLAVLIVSLTTRITIPLRELVRGVQQISCGALKLRMALNGEDEVAELALAFNELIIRLQVSITKQKFGRG